MLSSKGTWTDLDKGLRRSYQGAILHHTPDVEFEMDNFGYEAQAFSQGVRVSAGSGSRARKMYSGFANVVTRYDLVFLDDKLFNLKTYSPT